jgi:hypothetical protein
MIALFFVLGLVCGIWLTSLLAEQLIKEHKEHTRQWHQRAMNYMELWWQENEKRHKADDHDNADWWKKL